MTAAVDVDWTGYMRAHADYEHDLASITHEIRGAGRYAAEYEVSDAVLADTLRKYAAKLEERTAAWDAERRANGWGE